MKSIIKKFFVVALASLLAFGNLSFATASSLKSPQVTFEIDKTASNDNYKKFAVKGSAKQSANVTVSAVDKEKTTMIKTGDTNSKGDFNFNLNLASLVDGKITVKVTAVNKKGSNNKSKTTVKTVKEDAVITPVTPEPPVTEPEPQPEPPIVVPPVTPEPQPEPVEPPVVPEPEPVTPVEPVIPPVDPTEPTEPVTPVEPPPTGGGKTTQSVITWSGIKWNVTESNGTRWGAGNNLWSSNSDNVWVDSEDKLHLKITYRNGKWYCPEIYSQKTFGYGKYNFYLESKVDNTLNENAVLGLFTYDNFSADKEQASYREIDIEFSRWGNPKWDNSSYTIWPSNSGNSKAFNTVLTGNNTVHSFNWQPSFIEFTSLHGHNVNPYPRNDYLINQWMYTGKSVPNTSQERAFLNLWLVDGKAPSDGKEIEIIVSKFEFKK